MTLVCLRPRYALTLVLALCPASVVAGQQPSQGRTPGATVFSVRRAATPMRVDGRLDEPAWEGAEPIPLAWEWFPGDNLAPPVETRCWVTYDARSLYMACEAADPHPEQIRAHLADRDDLNRTPQDDHIVLLLDPFNDERRAFQFRVNPLGVQMDAVLSTAEGFEDFSWDAIWASAGRITAEGYVVEVAIPFRSLRFPKTTGLQTWGIIIERSYPRSNRHRVRSMPTDRSNSCLLCQANKLTGLQGISPGLNLELTPTLTSSRSDTIAGFPDGGVDAGKIKVDPGVDLRWGLTSNMSLNATVNPDFSQVEADAAQLDVNTRFALFFPEKRPFFLEGADFFNTPVNAVFTRTVAAPLGGLKLTGKAGANGIGLFGAYDRVTNLVLPANEGSASTQLADSSFTTVVRYRRDVGSSSYIGLLYTDREGSGYFNRVGGFDAFVQISRSNSLRAQYLLSATAYPAQVSADFGQPAEAFTGGGLEFQLQHASRDWFAYAQYEDLSPEFRADAGFVPRVDQREVGAGAVRNFWGPRGAWYTRLHAGLTSAATWKHDGTLTDREVAANIGYLGPLQTSLTLFGSYSRERLRDVDHDMVEGGLALSIRPSGAVVFNLSGHVGGAVDVANNRESLRVVAAPSVQFSVGRPLTVNVSHVYQRLMHQGQHIFTANLAQSRIFLHFSTRAHVRAVVQFQDVRRNLAEFPFPVPNKSQSLFTQLLFSYKLNPQTVAFLGYSDDRAGLTDVALTQTGRTFFAK
ncbi:MAG TPA: DUF5916 domain-containing protein, partial [Gemmatimonadales bacterium]